VRRFHIVTALTWDIILAIDLNKILN